MVPSVVRTKRCPRCLDTKPPSDFHRNKSAADGLCAYCKPCWKIKLREYGKNPKVRAKRIGYCRKFQASERGKAYIQNYERTHRAQRLAQVRRYQATEKGKATRKRTDEKRKRTPPIRARARIRMRVHRGTMPAARSLPCSKCGNPAHEYHHHLGYDPPHDLDVIPLCRSCHKSVH